MKTPILIVACFCVWVAAAWADFKPSLTISVQREQDRKNPAANQEGYTGVSLIRIQNVGRTPVEKLTVKYRILTHDLKNDNVVVGASGEQVINVQPAQATVIRTTPADVKQSVSREKTKTSRPVHYYDANNQMRTMSDTRITSRTDIVGYEYIGIAVDVYYNTERISSYQDNMAVKSALERLSNSPGNGD